MKLRDYKTDFIEKLTPLYDSKEAEQFFYITLEELKGWKRIDLALQPDAKLTPDEIDEWNAVAAQLEQQKPIQYIFGKAHFYGLDFNVNEHTLIPRPETEELAEWIIKENQDRGRLKILDIGTGSGCIAITLAKNLPEAQVYAMDVSKEALAVARENANMNNTDVTFIEQDILAAMSLTEMFDIIVSNPPYVRELEKQEIKSNVLDYEPHLALFVADNDPLLFYRKIAQLAKSGLTEHGILYFEINQYLDNEMTDMLKQLLFKNIDLRKDIYGNYRMLRATV